MWIMIHFKTLTLCCSNLSVLKIRSPLFSSEYCNEWLINQHSVPLAQYGHHWSSISGILHEDQTSETDSVTYQNGDSSKLRVRKVSNIPMGQDGPDENGGDQNGHDFPVGTNGVRDVRKQKTMFTNLSPYRN